MTTPLPLNTELKSGFQRTYMSIYNAASYSLSAEYTDCRFRKPKHAYGMSASRRVATRRAWPRDDRPLVRPPTPTCPILTRSQHASASRYMNRRARLLQFLPCCPSSSREPKRRFGLREAPVHTFILFPFHLYSTVEEGRGQRALGQSLRGGRLLITV
jgi:hypothetical protein